jgi:hypothetical protein
VIHADGIYGGVTPTTGNLIVHVFSHRLPIPEQSANDTMGNEVPEKRVVKPGIDREVEASLVMNLSLAKSFRDWLNERIAYIEKTQPETKK